MVYRKGEVTKRRVLRDWPHFVRLTTPPGGWGQRLNVLHEHCRGVDHQVASDSRPGLPDGSFWCFRSAGDAEKFRAFVQALIGG